MNVITRFAPSPTGYFHAGSYRTALFACIFARQNKGKFILRIEDTDKERSKREYEENIIDSLKWLGLDYDELYRQSDRTQLYSNYIKKLIDSGHAYMSDESTNNTDQRASVIRFKNPKKKVAFIDLIRGNISFDTTELGDFVIAKSVEEPVFHLVNVVDDHEMGITHIIRGEDHISNTPRQILIFEALGIKPPIYAHIPLLLAKDRSKLSKRNGAVPITEYRKRGFLSQAILNYLALLGWHPADNREFFSFDELLQSFSLERVQKGGAVFDEEKLAWFNRHYIEQLSDEEFIENSKPFLPEWVTSDNGLLENILPPLRDKVKFFGELATILADDGELGFIQALPEYPVDLLLPKKSPDKAATLKHLSKVLEILNSSDVSQFNAENVKEIIWPYAEREGKSEVLWPMRVALTGKAKSPDPFTVSNILGREEVLKRIQTAIKKLD